VEDLGKRQDSRVILLPKFPLIRKESSHSNSIDEERKAIHCPRIAIATSRGVSDTVTQESRSSITVGRVHEGDGTSRSCGQPQWSVKWCGSPYLQPQQSALAPTPAAQRD
jgi:hypothetical protein